MSVTVPKVCPGAITGGVPLPTTAAQRILDGLQ